MNKEQLIEREVAKNRKAFGRWASTRQVGKASRPALLHESPPRNEEEAVQHGNALAATGNYPVGTSDCFNVGISGGCGTDCFVYKQGRCPSPEDIDADAL